jgi:hypothetical protein
MGAADAAVDMPACGQSLADTDCDDRSAGGVRAGDQRGTHQISYHRGDQTRPDGMVQVESIDYRPGTAWLLDRLAALNADWQPVGVVLNPSAPEGSLIPGLQQLGIEPILITGREEAQACGAFYDALVDKRIRHGNQAALNIAVEQAVAADG